MLHNVSDALALGGFQFLLQVRQYRLQVGGALLRLRYVLGLSGKVGVETFQHIGGVVLHLLDLEL